MGADKHGSRGGGGYVGGFFQLFDWNAKSRKKLFSNKSEFSERSKQGKRSDKNLPSTRFNLIDEDEIGASSSIRGSSDYSCASSVTDDEGYGSKAPGVVARLMGLDSLPSSNLGEPSSTPFFDTQSLQDAHYHRRNLEFDHDNQLFHSGSLINKVEGPSRSTLESKPQKYLSRPIEKFQTEVLPPKSAKSISITHHKLLSPIKNPGFVSAKNKVHIMEIAAKIIEPGPQAIPRARMPSIGSSSVPLKVRDLKEKAEAAKKMPALGPSSVTTRVGDLKEKVEAAQRTSRVAEPSRRPVESNAAKYLKGQSLNKSWNGSEDTTSLRVLADTKESSVGSRNKEKSISLAIQAKVNVQKREGLNSAPTRSFAADYKEQNDVNSSQLFKSQPNNQKSMHKRSSTHGASGVLRQNNQKQNCSVKDKLPLKPLASNSQSRRTSTGESSSIRHKNSSKYSGNSKSGSRKMSTEVKDSDKDVSSSNTTNVPRKKRNINGDFQFEKNQGFINGLIDKSETPIQSNSELDRNFSWIEESRKKGTDIVSFTFTAPMTRPMPGSNNLNQMAQRDEISSPDFRGKRTQLSLDSTMLSSSLGLNAIGSDALSILLEQKLRELTSGVGSSTHDAVKIGSAPGLTPIIQHMVPNINAVSTNSTMPEERNKFSRYDSGASVIDSRGLRTDYKFQGADEMDVCSKNQTDAKHLPDCQLPSPVSIFEGSFSTESCNSSRSIDTSNTYGSKLCSSVEAREILGLGSLKRVHYVDADTDLSDSASSTSCGVIARKVSTTFLATDYLRLGKWELEYIKQIMCNIDLMFKDFAVGWASEILNPHLFNQLESRKRGFGSNGDVSLLKRKMLFDCVGECLDLRCRRYIGGGCKSWSKGVAMVSRKDWLAEEVYKEISGLEGMGDCMVDELVDKDMSSQYGKWTDFEVEEFALGVELDGQIFDSLVDEVVFDFLLC